MRCWGFGKVIIRLLKLLINKSSVGDKDSLEEKNFLEIKVNDIGFRKWLK